MIRRLPLGLQEFIGDLPLILLVAALAGHFKADFWDAAGVACGLVYGVNTSRDTRARVRAERRRREDLKHKQALLARSTLRPSKPIR